VVLGSGIFGLLAFSGIEISGFLGFSGIEISSVGSWGRFSTISSSRASRNSG